MRYSFECGTLYFSIDCTDTVTFVPSMSSSPLKRSSVVLSARITLGNNFNIFAAPFAKLRYKLPALREQPFVEFGRGVGLNPTVVAAVVVQGKFDLSAESA